MEEWRDEYSIIQVPGSRVAPHGCMTGCFGALSVEPKDACTICSSPWRFWRRKYTCGVCELDFCSSCAGTEQTIGDTKRVVCDMCVMQRAHRRKPDAELVEVSHHPAVMEEPMCAFEILEKGSLSVVSLSLIHI
eukprot:TRINITY_DN13951_c0_g1_i3.p1 TRINITY_DN13951_c0_g1~~TRINITY_DN13951_c0_g1_i3.p1  ORF type:complete len:134 (-),score=23.59 TRINITY_DN13951_c0_g1_i3:116-517(-)